MHLPLGSLPDWGVAGVPVAVSGDVASGGLESLLASDGDSRPHLRVIFELDSGDRLLYTDPRRFGTGVVLLGSEALEEYFASRIGVPSSKATICSKASRK